MQEQEGLPVERITLAQFAQAMAGQEVRGMPTGEVAYPVIQPRDSVVEPGQELAKYRVRVSFDFDVTCSDEPIVNSLNDDDVKGYEMALLTQFLHTAKAIELMVDTIGTKLGLNSPETFVETFLGQVDTGSHSLFSEAIDGLSGENGEHWQRVREDPYDLLGMFTESIFECFNAEFVSSSYEVVEDKPKVVHNYLDDEAIKAAKHLQVREK